MLAFTFASQSGLPSSYSSSLTPFNQCSMCGPRFCSMHLNRAVEEYNQKLDAEQKAEEAARKAGKRTLGLAHLGGATLDDEENYLLKKLYTALGIVQVENQARI